MLNRFRAARLSIPSAHPDTDALQRFLPSPRLAHGCRAGARAEARDGAGLGLVICGGRHTELEPALERLVVGQHAHRYTHVVVEEVLRRHLAAVDANRRATRGL
eukprot:scaffold18392_cov129-Isochrysis_galbana.AAC.4